MDEIYSNVSRSTERGFQPFTWKELAEDRAKEISRLSKWASLCRDLDRCEHGRHEGDVCSSCGGPSHGNQLGRHIVIGHNIDGRSIRIPDRDQKHDPANWIVT